MQLDLVLEPDTPGRFRELGLLAEGLGFGTVWTANHVAGRDPFMCFMPLAEASSSLRVGPIAVSPFELHPVKIANQLYTLNEYSSGRASIVIGGGGGTVIGMGLKPGRRDMMPRMVRAVRECVEFLRGAATERPFNYDGELYQVQGYHPEWAPDDSALIYVAAARPQMLRMASRVGDGVMFSDVTLPRMEETMTVLRQGLSDNNRDTSTFRVSNLYTWHVKTDREAAYREARAKLFVRGMLEHWYVSPFLTPEECSLVEESFPAFAQAYIRNSPDVEGVPDELVNKLVDNLTWIGDENDIDRIIEEMRQFKAGGVTELAIRLYGEPEQSIRLIAERVMPALR
ncbi:MAG: LLM class flavin-dependent oxidoreductase [Gammaproteobacteria bacterium]|jgi:alkanesulfonate monooxygenase SsuD/methylene tetrahydromethanopterin reductase-like flavin-dependent oxidoreductase (luciferase family)|nr:LLM class flavin-dependent oxidoreductase [Gammaproteobacteria bacterium]MDP6615912.1 LLM class flavin-dependent oxidoreductase [Gammaproteobacteria bacterium]MDP6695049.1 LLM class flavin-dependent oxidoreductase [Gammaproteobacteria bacterium]MDP7041745.1 LLM class flavin-dependent oxidoreductase [Gammaproteobacteria bacterium]